MMQVIHNGSATVEDIEKFELWFREYLGKELAKEFDEKCGIVQVDFNSPEKEYSLTIPNDDIGSFIARVQEYRKMKN